MTVTKTLLRKSFLMGTRYTGLARALRPVLEGQGAILMLHRVGPVADGLSINGFLSVCPAFLDRLLAALKRDGFVFCAMDEVLDRMKSGHTDERFLAVTLDDGYRDNFVSAAPVFEAHDVPYTIYVCPGFVEGYAHLWWENLSTVIEQQDRITFSTADGPGGLDCRTAAEKWAAYDRLMDYLTSEVDEEEQRRFVDHLSLAYGIDPAAYVSKEIMSWDELRILSRSPLCTLGAHTLNHYHLARLAYEDAVFEIEQSANVLTVEIGEKPQHLAYPYGGPQAVGAREAGIARELGFATAVTTRHGLLHDDHASVPHCLPRVSINGNFQRPAYVRTLLSGIAVPLSNRGRKVVTV